MNLLVEEALKLRGTRFSFGSLDPNIGLDCLTFLHVCFSRLGFLPVQWLPKDYPKSYIGYLKNPSIVEDCLLQGFSEIEKNSSLKISLGYDGPKIGDILLFNTDYRISGPNHTSILLGNDQIFHPVEMGGKGVFEITDIPNFYYTEKIYRIAYNG